jgi:hypothetical protein
MRITLAVDKYAEPMLLNGSSEVAGALTDRFWNCFCLYYSLDYCVLSTCVMFVRSVCYVLFLFRFEQVYCKNYYWIQIALKTFLSSIQFHAVS